MIRGAGVTIYTDFDYTTDELKEHDLLLIVDPSSSVLVNVLNWGHKGIVTSENFNQVDMTQVKTMIGFNVNPWEVGNDDAR